MTATPEEINNALAIISENLDALDKEQRKTARGFKEKLVKNNTSRAAFVKKTIEELKEKGEIHMEDMKNYPAAPTNKDLLRKARSDALKAAKKQGFPTKKIGKKYVLDRDLSEHFESLKELVKAAPNLLLSPTHFEDFCEEKGVSVDAMKSAMKGKFSYVAARGVTSV